MISDGNLIANLCQVYEDENCGKSWNKSSCMRSITFLSPSYNSMFWPMMVVYGLHILLHQSCIFGITLLIMPSFDPKLFLELVKRYPVRLNWLRKYGITNLFLVPPIMLSLGNQLSSSFNFAHQVLGVYSAHLHPKITKTFPAARLRQAWGITESAVCLTVCLSTGPTLHHSAGIIYPSVQLVLIDPETLESVPPSETGEVWVRSPSVTVGNFWFITWWIRMDEDVWWSDIWIRARTVLDCN